MDTTTRNPSTAMIHLAWTTVETEEQAEALAKSAVQTKVAACAQISGPIRSFYRWKGNLEEGLEWRVVLKIPAAKAGDAEAWLRQAHPYEVPQWVVVQADHVLPEYGQWAEASVGE